MPAEKLIDLTPDKLASGMFPSAEPASGETWNTGSNVWFRELSVEQVLGRVKAANLVSASPPRSSQAMQQQFTTDGHKRIFFEDGGIIKYIQDPVLGTVVPGASVNQIGTLSSTGDYDLETWGDWIAATDGTVWSSTPGTPPGSTATGSLQLWKNTGSLAVVPDAATQFKSVKILKRLAQMLLAYNTDVLPTGFHWSDANDPTVWIPSSTVAARNLNIRNLGSPIVAVCNLGIGHGVYASDALLVVQYLGPNQWFGTPNQALIGIGAVSKHSVVAVGQTNFGLSRAGVFATDGSSFQYIDRPAIDKWIQQNVDWTRASKIAGYYNDKLGLVIWAVPLIGGQNNTYGTVAVDPKTRQATAETLYLNRRTFTYLDNKVGFGIERMVFDYPVISQVDGIYFDSVINTLSGNFTLSTNLFDGGMPEIYKMWDYMISPGSYGPDAQVQFGFTDIPDLSTVQWGSWTPLSVRVPFPDGPRESVYLAINFQSQNMFRLAGIKVYGEKGGLVN